MIEGGNWWRENEIIIRHLTRRTAARYHSRDNAVPVLLCAHVAKWIAGRVFNLDDIGAEIAHKRGDERAGEESCAIDYAQTFQGSARRGRGGAERSH
jgi:hypothetical protein